MLWVLACTPCPEEPTFRNRAGQAGEPVLATLEATYDEFLAWTASDGLCIAEVEVDELWDGGAAVSQRGGWRFRIDPDSNHPEGRLREQLCHALDVQTGLSDEAADLFSNGMAGGRSGWRGELEAPQGEFAMVCGWGPADDAWAAEMVAACGESNLGERERFLSERVYPDAPSPESDGTIHRTLEPWVGLEPLQPSEYVPGYASWGPDLARVVVDPELPGARLERLDTGNGAVLGSGELAADDDSWFKPFGGSAPAVLVQQDGVGGLLTVGDDFDVSLLPTEVDPSINNGAVGGEWFFGERAVATPGPIWAVPLLGGEVVVVDLPTTEEGTDSLVSGAIIPTAGGFVVSIADADVERVAPDFVVIGVHRRHLYRYDLVTAEWTVLEEDLDFQPYGPAGDGRIQGRVFSAAAQIFAVYDPAAGELLLDEGVCFDYEQGGVGHPVAVVDGQLTWVRAGDEGHELTQAL